MSGRPFVSIVIPTYERAGFVESAILSVLEQEYPELEVIVVDDGSTDGTDRLLERIAERADPDRFTWWRHENVGQAESLNRGWARSRGNLIGYLSSDDVLLPGAIERLVEATEEHPEAEVFYPYFRLIDETDRTLNIVRPVQHRFIDALRWGLCLPGAGTVVRRSTFERVGGWNPENRSCPDYEWYLRAGDVGFVVVPEVLATWRSHGGSISVNTDLGLLHDQLRFLDDLFGQPDLPEAMAAVRNEAYASALINVAAALEGPNLGAAGRRFAVEDRVTPRLSEVAIRQRESELGAYRRGLASAEHQVAAQAEIASQAQQAVSALEDAALHREARIRALEGQLEAARAAGAVAGPDHPTPRPTWLRVGRRLTPAPLRHRVGVLVHRLRRPAR
jgi:glycosyltransferase involved in cell wall biosynthesis